MSTKLFLIQITLEVQIILVYSLFILGVMIMLVARLFACGMDQSLIYFIAIIC